MSNTIQNTYLNASSQLSTEHVAAHVQKGSWRGFNVQSLNKGVVNVADMAEEVALSLANYDTEKDIKRKQDESTQIERAQATEEQSLGMSHYELEIFIRAFGQQPHMEADNILDLVQKFFRDPSLQDAALGYLMGFILESDPRYEKIKKARTLLQEKRGTEVRAGYNIALVERGNLSAQQARDCYRFNILNYSSYEQTFKNLLKDYNPEDLPNTVTFLRKALGADMQSLEPSCDLTQLHEISEGLYVVQNLGNLYNDVGKLQQDISKRFKHKEPHAREIMLGVLQSKDNLHITEPSLRQCMPFLISKNPSRDAVFVRAVREVARNIPTKLYASEEQRQKLLASFQQNLDKAITREEELEV